jgi:hypothetical protein
MQLSLIYDIALYFTTMAVPIYALDMNRDFGWKSIKLTLDNIVKEYKIWKFTNIQKEHFRHLVLACIVQRLTTQENLQYVKDRLGSEIGADHFNHVRAELKRDVKKNPSYLQKDRFAYVCEFFDRIEEIRHIQKRLWKLMEDTQINLFYKKVVYLNSINQH